MPCDLCDQSQLSDTVKFQFILNRKAGSKQSLWKISLVANKLRKIAICSWNLHELEKGGNWSREVLATNDPLSPSGNGEISVYQFDERDKIQTSSDLFLSNTFIHP